MKSVSGKKLCKVLQDNGWTLLRIKGSHHYFAKEGNPITIAVPVHGNRDLKTGILAALLKDAELTEVDV